jgi:hypothetical protein
LETALEFATRNEIWYQFFLPSSKLFLIYKSASDFRPGTLELTFEGGHPLRFSKPWKIELAAPPLNKIGIPRVVCAERTFESLATTAPEQTFIPLDLGAVTITFKPTTPIPENSNTPAVTDFDKLYIGIWNDFGGDFTRDETACVLVAKSSWRLADDMPFRQELGSFLPYEAKVVMLADLEADAKPTTFPWAPTAVSPDGQAGARSDLLNQSRPGPSQQGDNSNSNSI